MTKDEIDDLLLRVYNARVDTDSGPGSAARMMENDADGGKKQRTRALFYQPVVLEVLVQLGLYVRHLPPRRVVTPVDQLNTSAERVYKTGES